jgi:hypothetical protein
MSALQVFVDGVGLYGPGLNGWGSSRAVLAQPDSYSTAALQLPAIESLPAAERRRLGVAVKLAMATGLDAVSRGQVPLSELSTVFTSSAGDSDNCHHLLETLATPERAVSPTRFHNSVHNAAAGYWSIAAASRRPSTSLSALDGGFAAGLLEAATQVCCSQTPCLLIAFDTPYPAPMSAKRPIAAPLGVALLLTPQRGPNSQCAINLALSAEAPAVIQHAALEDLRAHIPAARALPLLQALALSSEQSVVLPYLHDLQLAVTVQQ